MTKLYNTLNGYFSSEEGSINAIDFATYCVVMTLLAVGSFALIAMKLIEIFSA